MSIEWDAIRRDYEAGNLSIRKLAAKYGVSKTYLIEKRDKEGWIRPTDHRPLLTTQKRQHPHLEVDIKIELGMSLYLQRHTYQEIAIACGYSDRAAAYNALHRRMDKRIDSKIDEIRERELAILDTIHQKVWPLAIEQATPNLWAVDRLLAISLARRQLLNLDIKPDDSLAGVTIVRSYGVEVSKV